MENQIDINLFSDKELLALADLQIECIHNPGEDPQFLSAFTAACHSSELIIPALISPDMSYADRLIQCRNIFERLIELDKTSQTRESQNG